jgi:hypothetical protein
MSTPIGQTSQFQPAVILDSGGNGGIGMSHMLFVSADKSNRLLHTFSAQEPAGSSVGQKWESQPINTLQTTHSAPAVALYQTPAEDLLVAVFIANDSTNRILWSALDLRLFYAKGDAPWSPSTALTGESARAIYACGTIGATPSGESPLVNVYFLANDDTGRLLVAPFVPAIEPAR